MSTKPVNVYEAKTQLSRLIESALRGDDVVIARAGKPVVRLVKWEPPRDRVAGVWEGRVRIADDFDEFTAQDERDWYGA
ncbi:type II toxin-antitoxin system Phd/YefM family antitoxin [Paramicrobacterium agarici]|uniref:Antitoxin n=1 Tax=Paramicrobacterium agarici TaxID=630514 RepID=A0A2A9DS76_9MICO|nr:type II toxin-antitoxin system prevent-host-death family antitoxin [Microbacterium agarici]PFG29434.1 prevent-host-death family protein [Microbacterium agarici]